MSEFDFLGGLLGELARDHGPNRQLPIPPGDDCALVPATGAGVLFAADMLLEGVHFDLAHTAPRLVGRKALAVNLSDIASMAGRPTSVTVALALPRRGGRRLAEEVMAGLVELARTHDVAVAGGDTNSWDGPLVVSVAITGEPHAKGSVTRQGARPGDWLLVTGPLGGSIHGRHLTFPPRLAEARLLHERYGLSAMIDLSDGLGSDLRHILQQSGVGACLHRSWIPVHPDVARHGTPPDRALDHALGDGEDFELCFALAPAAAATLLAEQPLGARAQITRIGEVTDRPGSLSWEDGSPVPSKGYAHQLG